MSGYKAVLANEYRKVISEKAVKTKLEKARAVKAGVSMEETSASIEEQERSRKLAAEHMHVSEWKVREVQGIDKKAR